MSRLLPIEDAAKQLGMPVKAFRRAAEEHGMLVRMGRAARFDPADFEELIDKCRDRPKALASTGEKTPASGPSSTERRSAARARRIDEKLKTFSQNTSENGAAQVVRLDRSK